MFIAPLLEKKLDTQKDVAEEKEGEHSLRSVAKAISWRAVGTLDTIVISLILTGELVLAFTIGSVEIVTKMILYFFHERIWNSIKWGKK